jgi:hypothetical protein
MTRRITPFGQAYFNQMFKMKFDFNHGRFKLKKRNSKEVINMEIKI